MCRVYGYHRTSTKEQHLDRGINSISEYCQNNGIILDEMFTDQQTGKNFDRPDYIALKRIIKKGDILIITEVDRLGRDKEGTLKELREFKDKGIIIRILELPTTLIDYKSMNNELSNMMMETINNMLIEMYASFAHAEMIKRATRQAEGIKVLRDKNNGDLSKIYGRKQIDVSEEIKQVFNSFINNEIQTKKAVELSGLTRPTFFRKLKEYKEGK